MPKIIKWLFNAIEIQKIWNFIYTRLVNCVKIFVFSNSMDSLAHYLINDSYLARKKFPYFETTLAMMQMHRDALQLNARV